MDRRSLFFAGAAIVSALLIPVTESEQRWVPIVLAVVYVAARRRVLGRPPDTGRAVAGRAGTTCRRAPS